MKNLAKLLLILLLAGTEPIIAQGVAGAQDLPVREYTPAEAVVALDASVNFRDAVTILNEYAERLNGTRIINRSSFEGRINLRIPGLHWRDALDMIAAKNNLMVTNYPDHIEVANPPTDSRSDAAPGSTQRQRKGPDRVIFSDTREIEIAATFFQGDRRYLREIGINWSAIRDGFVDVLHVGGSNVSEPQLNAQFNVGNIIGTGEWEVNALLNALEANNYGEILSSPKIKVMEGETGRIQVGQDFSIKQRDFAGNVIDQFFSTGTILEVRPWLIEDQGDEFIYMEVMAERSSAQPDAVSTLINKQEANTQILMLDGETTVIAGLYETEESTLRRGVPVLKDLPGWVFGLRYLFGYESVQYTQKELIIVIKATLVPSINDRVIEERSARERIQEELLKQRRRLE